MNLASYINDLLYRYNCVIIPNFGGFVTNRIGATIDKNSQKFYPPAKQVTFNSHLKSNDGLLANYISSSENISFENANNAIALTVNKWREELQSKPIQISSVGSLMLNENGQIIFDPNKEINHLAESFGLTSINSKSVIRNNTRVKPLVAIAKKEEKKGIPAFINAAAAAAILLTLALGGNSIYQKNQQKTFLASQEKAVEKKIQSATFVISNPLPTIELNAVKEKAKTIAIVKPFHIVAGAFQFPENAQKKVDQLIEIGYGAKIIGVNKWGLTQVSFNSFSDRTEAINNLRSIQKTVSKDAWLLTKK